MQIKYSPDVEIEILDASMVGETEGFVFLSGDLYNNMTILLHNRKN